MSAHGAESTGVHGFTQAQGLGRHGWPRTLGVVILTIGGAVAGSLLARFGLLPAIKAAAGSPPELEKSAILIGLAALVFGSAAAALGGGVRWLHGRPAYSLVTAAPRFRWGHLALGFSLTAVVVASLGATLQGLPLRDPFTAAAPATLLWVLPLLVVGFTVQAGVEELVFRGYLLQVGFRTTRSSWLAAAVSIALFTAAHLGYGVMTAVETLIIASGLTLSVLMLKGLEFTIGAHIANNLTTALLFQDLSHANAPAVPGTEAAEIAGQVLLTLAIVAGAAVLRFQKR